MSHPYIKSLSTNIKHAGNRELSAKTLIVGPSLSGKSAILQAAALALTGAADDVAGRQLVERADFVGALSDDNSVMAVATLSDGSTVTYGGGKKNALYPDAWVWRVLREALTGAPDKARTFILNVSGLGALQEDHARAKQAHERAADAEKLIREELAGLTAEAVDPPDPAELARAEKLVNLWRERCAAATSLGNATTAFRERGTERARALARRSTAKMLDDNTLELLKQVVAIGDAHDSVCLVCKGPAPAEDLREKRRTQLREALALREDAFHTIETAYAAAEKQLDLMRARAITCGLIGEDDMLPTQARLAECAEQQAAAQSTLSRLQDQAVRAQAWTHAVSARQRLTKRLGEAAAAAAIAKGAYEAQAAEIKVTVTSVTRAFEKAATHYLPVGWQFGIDVDNRAARFGLRRGDKLHTALSGAEWATVLGALAALYATTVPADQPLVFAPEDRGWDAETLAGAMQGLAKAPLQVLLTSTVDPGDMPGWQVIRLPRSAAR